MNGDHEKKHRAIDDRIFVLNAELDSVEMEVELQAAILKNLSEGVMLVRTNDAVIVYTNPQMDTLFGYEENELKGNPVTILSAADKTMEEAKESLKAYPEKVIIKEMNCKRKDNSTFLCLTRTSTFDHKAHGKVWVTLHTTIY